MKNALIFFLVVAASSACALALMVGGAHLVPDAAGAAFITLAQIGR